MRDRSSKRFEPSPLSLVSRRVARSIYLWLVITSAWPTLTFAEATLYKWTDKNGEVHYSNVVPPEHSRQQRSILNDHGMTVKTIEAAKTPEQIAEEARLRDIYEQQRKEEEKRAAHDRMLLSTFPTLADLEKARDTKITTIENIIKIAEANRKKQQQALTHLQKKAAEQERSGQAVSAKTNKQIENTKAQMLRSEKYIEQKRQEQVQIRQEYGQDIKRYQELKAQLE